jgi:hypothetical protein
MVFDESNDLGQKSDYPEVSNSFPIHGYWEHALAVWSGGVEEWPPGTLTVTVTSM